MHTKWFYDCRTPEERSERIKMVRAHPEIVKVINNMLKRDLADVERKQTSPADYTSPAWAYQQADHNGVKRVLQEFIQILDQEEINK